MSGVSRGQVPSLSARGRGAYVYTGGGRTSGERLWPTRMGDSHRASRKRHASVVDTDSPDSEKAVAMRARLFSGFFLPASDNCISPSAFA